MYSSPRALALKLLFEPTKKTVPKVRIMLHKQPAVEGMWQGCTGFIHSVSSSTQYSEYIVPCWLVGRVYFGNVYKGYFIYLRSRNWGSSSNPVWVFNYDNYINCDNERYDHYYDGGMDYIIYSDSSYSNAGKSGNFIIADWTRRQQERYGSKYTDVTGTTRLPANGGLRVISVTSAEVITADTDPKLLSSGYYFGDGLTLENYLTAQKAFAEGEAVLGVEPDSMTT